MKQISNGTNATNATMGPRDQTKQEVVHGVFANAHDARKHSDKAYVPKTPGFEKNMTAKEMGIEGVPDKEAIPNDPKNKVANGETLAQEAPTTAVANDVTNSEKSVE